MQQGEGTDPRCAECQDVSAAYCNRCAPAVFAVQSRIKVKPEGATDPLREAMAQLVAVVPNALASPLCECDKCAAYLDAVSAAREALAVAPEPEWEYRAVMPWGLATGPLNESSAWSSAKAGGGHIERRRVPGEWEALPDAD